MADPRHESRLSILESLKIYVPRDERFNPVKMSDIAAYGLKLIIQFLVPGVKALFDKTFNEFEKIEEIVKLYEGEIKLSDAPVLSSVRDRIPSEMLRELLRTDGEPVLKFPMPQVIKGIRRRSNFPLLTSHGFMIQLLKDKLTIYIL